MAHIHLFAPWEDDLPLAGVVHPEAFLGALGSPGRNQLATMIDKICGY